MARNFTLSGFARSISCFCCLFSTNSLHSGLDVFAQNLLSQGHELESNEKSKNIIYDPDHDPERSFTNEKLARQWELRENGETVSDADSAFGDDFKYRLSHVRSDWYSRAHKELWKEHPGNLLMPLPGLQFLKGSECSHLFMTLKCVRVWIPRMMLFKISKTFLEKRVSMPCLSLECIS